MLHATTIFLVAILADALFCLCGLILWRMQRQIPGMLPLALSFAARGGGFLLLLTAPVAWAFAGVWFGNALAALSMVLMLEGFARFLGRIPPRRLQAFVLAVVVVGWPILLLERPEDIVTRIALFSFLIGLCYAACAGMFWHDRTQPVILRRVMLTWCWLIVASAAGRALGAWFAPPENILGANAFQEIYLLIHLLSFLFMGVMTAILVGVRLRAEQLAHLEGEREKLLMLSHELRTPLAIVSRASEMLESLSETLDPATARRVGHIRQAVGRMNDLVETFLGRTHSAEQKRRHKRFDLVDVLRSLAESPRIILETPGSVEFEGDRKMIKIIFSNLLDNALKYSPDDTPVDVSLAMRDGRIVLTVQDRGIGLGSIAERPRLGEKFFRASNALHRPGSGLGLYTARKLAARHDGTITLAPRDGGGTVATLVLRRDVHAA